MIRPKTDTKHFLLSMIKNYETLFKKNSKKSRRRWNLNLTNQEKRFILIHLHRLKDLG